MSVILFKCSPEKKEDVKKNVWNVLHQHYSGTVYPNTRVQYEHEGDEVYAARLHDLMKASLCKIEDKDNGIRVEFDSTEDAGFEIAHCVYGTSMGYSDEGLVFLKPVFDAFIKTMPDICFEGECECSDKWTCEEYHCSYDGENFECDAEWMEWEE